MLHNICSTKFLCNAIKWPHENSRKSQKSCQTWTEQSKLEFSSREAPSFSVGTLLMVLWAFPLEFPLESVCPLFFDNDETKRWPSDGTYFPYLVCLVSYVHVKYSRGRKKFKWTFFRFVNFTRMLLPLWMFGLYLTCWGLFA